MYVLYFILKGEMSAVKYKHFLIETKDMALKIARDLALLGYWQKVVHDTKTNSYELITMASSEEVYILQKNYIGGTREWIML